MPYAFDHYFAALLASGLYSAEDLDETAMEHLAILAELAVELAAKRGLAAHSVKRPPIVVAAVAADADADPTVDVDA